MIIVDGPNSANFTLVLAFSGGSGKGITGIFGVEQLFAAINRMDSTATDKINKVMVATEEIRTPRQHKLLKGAGGDPLHQPAPAGPPARHPRLRGQCFRAHVRQGVRSVSITDDFKDMMPSYLDLVKCVVGYSVSTPGPRTAAMLTCPDQRPARRLQVARGRDPQPDPPGRGPAKQPGAA